MTEAPRRPELALGILLVALVAFAGGRDLGFGLEHWDSYSPVELDEPVPPFQARVDDGSELSPAALEGQVSLLTFWATWCHACGLEMPVLSAIERRYAGTDLHIYGVNRDGGDGPRFEAAVRAYMADHAIGFPQIYDDGRVARAFGVEAIPHMVLVDRRGRVRHVHMGRVSERTLRKEIDALLAE